MSVPTREFAAAFVALGAAAALYSESDPGNTREHFERLAGMPVGTYVTWREGDYLKCGTLDGWDTVHGDEYVRVNGGQYRRRWDMCGEIHPLGEGEQPFVNKKKLAVAGEFVRSALGVDAAVHAMHSSIDCLIVGVKSAIDPELTEQIFRVRTSDGGPASGTLQDLLRCRALTPSSATHYRTDLLPAYSPEVPRRLDGIEPPAVVLDGASAFLRWRGSFPSPLLIAVLDRSAPSSEAAAHAFAADRAASLRDVEIVDGTVPNGIEVIAFQDDLA